jgi:S1-C subfamily serine protease
VRIGEVLTEGPAARAGLREGDIILAVDGAAVDGTDDLIRLLGSERIGHETVLSILRDGRTETLAVWPDERRA